MARDFTIAFLTVAALLGAPVMATRTPPSSRACAADSTRVCPWWLEPNAGQAPAGVDFVASGGRSRTWISRGRMAFPRRRGPVIRFAGWRPGGPPTPLDPLPARVNYVLGSDPSHWVQGLIAYRRARYRDIYPGIDVEYYGSPTGLEYDLIAAPGADLRRVRLAFDGAKRVEPDGNGGLRIHTASGVLKQRAPHAYQEARGRRVPIPARCVLLSSAAGSAPEAHFDLGDYDRTRTLVIDPELDFSTYLGGTGVESAAGVCAGPQGTVYVVGTTESLEFPTARPVQPGNGAGQDAFVLRLDPQAPAGEALRFATYLGGELADQGAAIAAGAAGNVWVTGTTASLGFPRLPDRDPHHGGKDAFLACFSPGGRLLLSRLVGGSGDDEGLAVADGGAGAALVAGATESPDFPAGSVPSTGKDAFVVRVDTFTPVRGVRPGVAGDDAATGVAAVLVGSAIPAVYAAGWRQMEGSGLDGFATRFDAALNTVWTAAVSGSAEDRINALTLDSQGSPWVAGGTSSPDFGRPFDFTALSEAASTGTDAFAVRLDPRNGAQSWAARLGGAGEDSAAAIAVRDGRRGQGVHLAGRTTSADLPTVFGIQALKGASDALVARIDTAREGDGAKLLFSTPFGSGGDDQAHGLCLLNGSTFVAGVAGGTGLALARPLQSLPSGTQDAFLARFRRSGLGRLAVTRTRIRFGEVKKGATRREDLELVNTGRAFLTVIVSPPPMPFSVTEGAGTHYLPPGAREKVTIRFQSPDAGVFKSGLVIASNDPHRRVARVVLTARVP